MDEISFWQHIDASRNAVQGDPEQQIEALGERLTKLEPDDIVGFDRLFSQFHAQAYTHELWGAAYIIGGGCSDDGFMDFRGWLISRGEKAYKEALADPETLCGVIKEHDGECQVEGFQYVATQAWEEKTGQDSDAFPDHDISYQREPGGKRWDEDDLDTLYPKLSKQFDC
jgi:hypothetical protein